MSNAIRAGKFVGSTWGPRTVFFFPKHCTELVAILNHDGKGEKAGEVLRLYSGVSGEVCCGRFSGSGESEVNRAELIFPDL